MEALLSSFQSLAASLGQVFIALAALLQPVWPLGVWAGFWLWLVDWRVLRPIIVAGGWLPLVALGVLSVGCWSLVDLSATGTVDWWGLQLSPGVDKTVRVTVLIVTALGCGAIQRAGLLGSWQPGEWAVTPQPESPTAGQRPARESGIAAR